MKKVGVILRKDWAEVFKNRLVLFSVAFLPLILTALPLVILYGMRSSGDLAGMSMADMPEAFRPLCGGLTGGECAQYFFVSQFLLLFMLMPLIIPATVASYSIVGEKTTRTLEPLLATPITTLELLAGKGLAAVVPAVLATWASFAVFAVGASLLAVSPAVLARLIDPIWLTAVFVVGPLLAIAAVSLAVMISSRVSDPRVAEQLSALVVLPIMVLFFGQITGFLIFNKTLVLVLAAGLAALDAVLIAFATQVFQRETILTRWK
ncbi:MAG: ABC transporter permease subunit [Chloroflexota bacterium]